MTDLEKKLNGLPKARLSRSADLRLRYRLFRLRFDPVLSENTAVLRPKYFVFKQAFAVTMLVIFIVSGTSVYAYSNDRVTRGNVLYPLKRGVERIELSLAVNPRSKVVVLNKLARRRLIEAQLIGRTIAAAGRGTSQASSSEQAGADSENLPIEDESLNEDLDKTIDEASARLDAADDESELLDEGEDRQMILKQMADADDVNVALLEGLAGTVGIDARGTVVDRVAVTLDRARSRQRSALQRLEKKTDDSSDKFSPKVIDATGTAPIIVDRKVDAEKSLGRMKDRIDAMRADLTRKKAPPKALNSLIKNLNTKMQNTKKAISDGDFEKAGNLLEKTEALTNNGDHFLRSETEEVFIPKTMEEIKAPFSPKIERQETEKRGKEAEKSTEKNAESDSDKSTEEGGKKLPEKESEQNKESDQTSDDR